MFYLTLTVTHRQGPPASLFLIKEESGLRTIGDVPIEIIKTLKSVKNILDTLGIPNNNIIDESITGESLAISFVEESLVVTNDNYEQVISQHDQYINRVIKESELFDLLITPIMADDHSESIGLVESSVSIPESPEAPVNIDHQILDHEEAEEQEPITSEKLKPKKPKKKI